MVLAWIAAVLGAAVAGACASADGALLALDPDAQLPGRLRALHDRRERAHRALAFARVMAQLSAGVAIAIALRLGEVTSGEALWKGGLAALALVGISEAWARS